MKIYNPIPRHWRHLRRMFQGGGPLTKVDRRIWVREAQEGEFQFHKADTWRQTEDFRRQSKELFEHFGLHRDFYRGKTIIDLGAGSKLRSKYFEGARLIAIEPLADRFLREIPWCDLRDAAEVYSLPAEEQIPQCVGRADLLISINVLDHCYNFEAIVDNVRDYLKPDGLAFLSFDKHEVADDMHPLQLTEEVCERIFVSKRLRIQKLTTGFGPLRGEVHTYGHGPYCMNYWLTRPE